MSVEHGQENISTAIEQPCPVISRVITPREKDIGGFFVHRVLPIAKQRKVGPFVFFDHMGPTMLSAGPGVNVRPHPHINLATVTYLFEGEILHRDSLGSVQPILPGDINLMVAGRGIVHSEREREELINTPRPLHGLQLWMALPEAVEEIEPAFYHYPEREIPHTEINDVSVRVMMGEGWGLTSPVKTFSKTLYAEAMMTVGQKFTFPANYQERAVYVASGEVLIDGVTLSKNTMAVLTQDKQANILAVEDCRLAFIGGDAMKERFMFWNFISSRKERIEQAKQDWKDGKFDKVPGDEKEFIPLPE